VLVIVLLAQERGDAALKGFVRDVLEFVGKLYFAVHAPPSKVPAAVTKIDEVKLADAELRK
jgi:hypothetical protein